MTGAPENRESMVSWWLWRAAIQVLAVHCWTSSRRENKSHMCLNPCCHISITSHSAQLIHNLWQIWKSSLVFSNRALFVLNWVLLICGLLMLSRGSPGKSWKDGRHDSQPLCPCPMKTSLIPSVLLFRHLCDILFEPRSHSLESVENHWVIDQSSYHIIAKTITMFFF